MDNSNNQQKQAPVQPAPPPAPGGQPPVPGQAPAQPGMPPYQMPPKKKMSKGVLWGIIGGSVGLVVVVVAVILAVVFLGGPSKEDYKDLVSTINSFNRSDISGGMSSDPDNYKKNVDKAIEKIDEYHKKIDSHKALKDKELKTAYDKYIDEWNKSKKQLAEAAEGIGSYRKYAKVCKAYVSVSYTTKTGDEVAKEFDEKTKDCIKTLKDMEKSGNSKVSEFAKSMSEYYSALKKYYVDVAKRYSSKDTSSAYPTYPKYPSTSSLISSMSKSADTKALDDSYSDFKNILEEKANK